MIATFIFSEHFRWSPEATARMSINDVEQYATLAVEYLKEQRAQRGG